MKAHGEEVFTDRGKDLGISVIDFWRYMYNDLLADPRNDLAEYLVAHALGNTRASNIENWELYDIDYCGKRIEVKCSGYFQTWRKDDKVSKQRTFSIAKAYTPGTELLERQNDVYVFCLLLGDTRQDADPTKLEHWEFYVVPTAFINEHCGENKTISLSRIKSFGFEPIPYAELKNEIDSVISSRSGT